MVESDQIDHETIEKISLFIQEAMSVEEFEAWLYASEALQECMPSNLYSELIEFGYRNYKKYELGDLKKKIIDWLGPKLYEVEIKRLAMGFLQNEISMQETVRGILSQMHNISNNFIIDNGFGVFIAFADETDHLPVKRTRHLWSKEGLARSDIELESIESRYRSSIEKACLRILKSDLIFIESKR